VRVILPRAATTSSFKNVSTDLREKVDGYSCQSCDHTQTDEPESPLYECCTTYDRANSNDGESNRCPECNKFGARIADYACDECHGEMEATTLYVCGCGKTYLTTDEVDACATEDAIPKRVKEKRAAEAKAKLDADHEEYRRKELAQLSEVGLEAVIDAIDGHGEHMLFHESNWTSKMGIMLNPHVAVELKCLVVDELERRHQAEASDPDCQPSGEPRT